MGNSPISKAMSFLLKRIVEKRWMCQRFLNALQPAGAAAAPQHETNSVLAAGTGYFDRRWHGIMPKARLPCVRESHFSMRCLPIS
jgi:hypothetical protein